MALITESEIRSYAQRAQGVQFATANYSKSAGTILSEQRSRDRLATTNSYTVFLSHSFTDQILILGVKYYLESFGHSVYVDWIDDKELDRSKVTKETARRLKSRMDNCRCLLFATTTNSTGSKWMPWELGYFDGKKTRAGIMPLAQAPNHEDTYVGQEYLGVYPYLVRTTSANRDILFMHTSKEKYVGFDNWLKGLNPPE